MSNKVKNLIFDLGNVIIDLDIPRTELSLDHVLGEDYKKNIKEIVGERDIFNDFEIGKINEETFFKTLRKAALTPLTLRQIKDAWNAMLLQIPLERLKMLERLEKKYRVFLLSNTNSTHIDWIRGYLREVHNIHDFEKKYFEKVYYSHEISLRKPHTDIYDFVVNDAKLIASESLFIDDNKENIEGAKLAGLQTLWHPVGTEITMVMEGF